VYDHVFKSAFFILIVSPCVPCPWLFPINLTKNVAVIKTKLQGCFGWSFTADAWSKMAREFFSVNAFFINRDDKEPVNDHVLTRVCLGVKRLEVNDDTIKTAKDQAEAIKVVCLRLFPALISGS
jgi:hypothetical protein